MVVWRYELLFGDVVGRGGPSAKSSSLALAARGAMVHAGKLYFTLLYFIFFDFLIISPISLPDEILGCVFSVIKPIGFARLDESPFGRFFN